MCSTSGYMQVHELIDSYKVDHWYDFLMMLAWLNCLWPFLLQFTFFWPKDFFKNRLLQLFELQFVLMIPAISSKVTTFWLYLGRWINPMYLGCSNHQVGQTVPMQLFVRTWNTRSAMSVIVCHASFFLLTLFSKVLSITSE